jgi:4a-hydroxytetrahydrobiopterin dehydratase
VTLEHPQGWNEVRGALQRGYRFRDFAEAIAFVDLLAAVAEEANHHPDIAISWNTVTVRWWTHVKRAITARDVELARRTDEVASSFSSH